MLALALILASVGFVCLAFDCHRRWFTARNAADAMARGWQPGATLGEIDAAERAAALWVKGRPIELDHPVLRARPFDQDQSQRSA